MDRRAVVIPGLGGSPYTPLLTYAALAAERRGAGTHRITWTPPDGLIDRTPDQKMNWVEERVEPLLREIGETTPLLIGNSLGTRAARLAAVHGLPAVWLAPVLRDNVVPDALRAATAPALLIGGADDPVWDGELARASSPHVFEVEGADHGLLVDGPLVRSTAVLGQVVTRVERFLDEVVWPER